MIGDFYMARVLIVDDTVIFRQKLKHILENEGHEVIGQAANGLQAAVKYKELKPDLVTMDIVMAESDGIDGIQRIKSNDPNAEILVVSSVREKEIVMHALSEGAHAYVLKPFEPVKIITTLENMGFKIDQVERDRINELKRLKKINDNTSMQLSNLKNSTK